MRTQYFERAFIEKGLIHQKEGIPHGVDLEHVLASQLPMQLKLMIFAGVADIVAMIHRNQECASIHLKNIFLTHRGVALQFQKTRYKPSQVDEIYDLTMLLLALLGDLTEFPPLQMGEKSNFGIKNRPFSASQFLAFMRQVDWKELAHNTWLVQVEEFIGLALERRPDHGPQALDLANLAHSLLPHCIEVDFSVFAAQRLPKEISQSPPIEREKFIPESTQGLTTGFLSRATLDTFQKSEPSSAPRTTHFFSLEQLGLDVSPEEDPFNKDNSGRSAVQHDVAMSSNPPEVPKLSQVQTPIEKKREAPPQKYSRPPSWGIGKQSSQKNATEYTTIPKEVFEPLEGEGAESMDFMYQRPREPIATPPLKQGNTILALVCVMVVLLILVGLWWI